MSDPAPRAAAASRSAELSNPVTFREARPATHAVGATGGAPLSTAAPAAKYRGALFHPLIDFLCLGGATLILLPLLARLSLATKPMMVLGTLLFANFINHPHFAHSYQIFYRNFASTAFSSSAPGALRVRYLIAGVVVPLGLLAFFAISVLMRSPQALSLGLNLMNFLVGWHYVKQGYGMAIVDSVLKNSLYSEAEKGALRRNGYACWIVGWLSMNRASSGEPFWGLKAHPLPVPDPLYWIASGVVIVTSALLFTRLVQRGLRKPRSIALTGLIAYLVTLYLWVLFSRVSPLFFLLIPALHSIQYLIVVWRYKVNEVFDRTQGRSRPAAVRLGIFVLCGFLLGFIGFWGLPLALDAIVPYDRVRFGSTLFMFMFWIFINVHHYFLDNVMWRRENPQSRKYLFLHS